MSIDKKDVMMNAMKFKYLGTDCNVQSHIQHEMKMLTLSLSITDFGRNSQMHLIVLDGLGEVAHHRVRRADAVKRLKVSNAMNMSNQGKSDESTQIHMGSVLV